MPALIVAFDSLVEFNRLENWFAMAQKKAPRKKGPSPDRFEEPEPVRERPPRPASGGGLKTEEPPPHSEQIREKNPRTLTREEIRQKTVRKQ